MCNKDCLLKCSQKCEPVCDYVYPKGNCPDDDDTTTSEAQNSDNVISELIFSKCTS